MKKVKMPIVMGVIVLALSACGQAGNPKETPTNAVGDTVKINDNMDGIQGTQNNGTAGSVNADPTEGKDGDENKDGGEGQSVTNPVDVLENLIGEYNYLLEDGAGRLAIKKTSNGYDISDYESEESEASYRFLADSSNIESIENSRIYIKYPEQVLSDDTVVFCYYILEYGTNEIDVYYGKSSFEEAEFLYHATKKTEVSNLPDRLGENAYFLPTNADFYEKLACNPIDQNYVIDEEAAPLEIWQSALGKCEAWNQQIDFTASKLEGLLSNTDDGQLQDAIRLWREYYQGEVDQNRELYGNSGMILGSMYTAISADVLMEKCKLTSFTFLSLEYELSGNLSFTEDAVATKDDGEYSILPQSFCIEYDSDFEEMLVSYSINEKDGNGLEELICETAGKIEEKFGHDFVEHANKYISFIYAIYELENDVSEEHDLCIVLKENRLKLYAMELLNIVYMMDGQ